MNIERYNFRGNTNIGLHASVTGKYAVFPPGFKRKDFFEAEVHAETTVARTQLTGLFTAGNSNCILVPDSITSRERKNLEDSGLEFRVLEVTDTALGNLILANDEGAVVGEKLKPHLEEIDEALGVDVEIGTVGGIRNPGAAALANHRGALLHREASEQEAEHVKKVLGLEEVDIGTVNLGSPFVGSGAAVTGENVLVGEDTKGPEIGRIDRVLGEG